MTSTTVFDAVDPAELARCLFEESNDGLFIFDPESMQILDVNPHAQRMTKYSRRELLQRSVPELFGSQSPAAAKDLLDSCAQTRIFHSRESCQLSTNEDEDLDVNVSVSRLHMSSATLGLISVRDVSSRKTLEADLRNAKKLLQEALNAQTKKVENATGALRHSETRLRELVDDVGAIVWEADYPCITFSYVSAEAEAILGYPVSDWETKPNFWCSLIHLDETKEVVSYCNAQTMQSIDHDMEYRLKAADGQYRWIKEIVHVVTNEEDKPIKVRGLMIDVTEAKNAEQRRIELDLELRKRERELAHVARLSTMGEMVAGISHEINQPLSAISNFANASIEALSAQPLNVDETVLQWLQQAADQSVRCGEIIRRLRGFTRKDDETRSEVDVCKAIRASVAMLNDLIREHRVDVELDLPKSGTATILGNETEFQQVLVNLLRNACEATVDAGIERPRILVELNVIPEHVRLVVQDNGPGISSEIASKLFDPFFTSRKDGMGMGLAISKTIVKNFDGTLETEESSKGARFLMKFPIASTSAISEKS